MHIEAGIGWGEAKLGASMKDLVTAFGQPTKQNGTLCDWKPLGMQVMLIDKAVTYVTLFANDDEEKGFTPSTASLANGIGFGSSEEQVLAAFGEPRRKFGTRDTFLTLVFDGIVFRVVKDRVVRVMVDERSSIASEAFNAELETAIIASPDENAPYLVYADWLTQQGRQRGGLIVEHASLGAPSSSWLKSNDAVLLGALAPFEDMITERTWRLGFLERVKVQNTFERSPDHDGELPEVAVSDVLSALLESEAGRFLRELTVGIVTYQDNDYMLEIAAIASRKRPLIRSLFLGEFMSEETELNWSSLGNAEPLWDALPKLQHVTLRSGSMELGRIVAPELLSFETRTGGLQKQQLVDIAAASWPKLERLSIQIGSDRYGSDIELADFDPILAGNGCPPTLTHLGLTNTDHSDALIERLANSAVLPRLEELDLSLGSLGPDGAASLAKHAEKFKHLKRLELSESWLRPADVDAVRAVLPNAVMSDQRYNERYPDDRYIAAGE